jgi:hypothetical protein
VFREVAKIAVAGDQRDIEERRGSDFCKGRLISCKTADRFGQNDRRKVEDSAIQRAIDQVRIAASIA